MSAKDVNPQITRRQAENCRAAIKVSTLIKRLQESAAGTLLCEKCAESASMTSAQIKAAQILLDKSLPTLQSIDSHIVSDKPELSPEELEQAIREAIRDYCKQEPEEVRDILAEVERGRLKVVK